MDRGEYIHKRKRKYMAQILEGFEELEQDLPEAKAGMAQAFKGLVRARLNALATDAVDIIELGAEEQNGLTLGLRDRLQPTRS